MIEIQFRLDDETDRLVMKAAWRLKLRKSRVAEILFKRGLRRLEELVNDREKELQKEGSLQLIKNLHSEKMDVIRETMEVETEIASYKFAVYSEFDAMSKVLIAYSGRRAQAMILASRLKDLGVDYDLTPGMAPNYDTLAAKYLFRTNEDRLKNDEQESLREQ
jgi:hypothetical protein